MLIPVILVEFDYHSQVFLVFFKSDLMSNW